MNRIQDLVSLTNKPYCQLTFLADIPPKLQHASAEKTEHNMPFLSSPTVPHSFIYDGTKYLKGSRTYPQSQWGHGVPQEAAIPSQIVNRQVYALGFLTDRKS